MPRFKGLTFESFSRNVQTWVWGFEASSNGDINPLTSTVPYGPTCVICNDDYQPGTIVCKINACDHTFHHQCITQWWARSTRCPICNNNLGSRRLALHGSSERSLGSASLSRSSSNADSIRSGLVLVGYSNSDPQLIHRTRSYYDIHSILGTEDLERLRENIASRSSADVSLRESRSESSLPRPQYGPDLASSSSSRNILPLDDRLQPVEETADESPHQGHSFSTSCPAGVSTMDHQWSIGRTNNNNNNNTFSSHLQSHYNNNIIHTANMRTSEANDDNQASNNPVVGFGGSVGEYNAHSMEDDATQRRLGLHPVPSHTMLSRNQQPCVPTPTHGSNNSTITQNNHIGSNNNRITNLFRLSTFPTPLDRGDAQHLSSSSGMLQPRDRIGIPSMGSEVRIDCGSSPLRVEEHSACGSPPQGPIDNSREEYLECTRDSITPPAARVQGDTAALRPPNSIPFPIFHQRPTTLFSLHPPPPSPSTVSGFTPTANTAAAAAVIGEPAPTHCSSAHTTRGYIFGPPPPPILRFQNAAFYSTRRTLPSTWGPMRNSIGTALSRRPCLIP